MTTAGEPASRPGAPPPDARAGTGDPGAPARPARAGEADETGAEHPAASRLDTGSLLYGTIVSAAALAVGATRGDTAGGMIETMVTTLLIYWFAHVYVAVVSARRPGSATPLHRLVLTSARREASILVGGLPAVLVVVILSIAHVALWLTVLSDAVIVILVLALDGLLAGLHAGTRGWRLGVEAASAAVLGVLIAVLLMSLHRH